MEHKPPSAPPRFTITCQACGARVPAEPWTWKHACGGTLGLDVAVDAARTRACRDNAGLRLARFAPVLPLRHAPATAIGDTPLSLEEVDGVRVAFKLEYLNPGGSFKDRGAYVTVSRCAELGFDSIVVDSSGNAGVATAFMGRRLGLKVDVFLPSSTPDGKKRLLRLLGAALHEVEGDRMAVHAAALGAVRGGAVYAGHWWQPYFAHGVKTMAYEVVEELGRIDMVFAPVGAGTVILGLHRGFVELHSAGLLATMPRLVAAQAAGYAPVCAELGIASEQDQRSHLADAIAIADPPRRGEMAAVVRQTGGFGVVVNDPDITAALRWLTDRGYIVEPTSAVPVAALFKAMRDGSVMPGSTVLIPLTGTGMKVLDELDEVAGGTPHTRCVPPQR
jgi:threonine synthase